MMPYVSTLRQRELPGSGGVSLHGHPVHPNSHHSPHFTLLHSNSAPVTPPAGHYQQPSSQVPRYSLPRPPFRTQSTNAVPTHMNVHTEMLRRKTPQGTLPAAYDAAPVEWAMRPAKQILLPAPYNDGQQGQGLGSMPPLQPGTGVQTFQGLPVPHQQHQVGTLRLQGVGDVGWQAPPQFGDDDPYGRRFLQQQQQQQNPQGMVPPLMEETPGWINPSQQQQQPLGFQPLYTPIPPPTVRDEDEDPGYLFGNAAGGDSLFPSVGADMMVGSSWPRGYSSWDTGQIATPSQLPDGLNGLHIDTQQYRPTPPPQFWTQQQQQHQQIPGVRPSLQHHQRSQSSSNINFSYPHNRPRAVNIIPDPNIAHVPYPIADNSLLSKEGVAIMAHRAYVDLLTLLQSQHRADAAVNRDSSSGAASPMKSQLFPRPPTTGGLRAALRQQQQQQRPNYMLSSRASAYPGSTIGDTDGLDRRKRGRSMTFSSDSRVYQTPLGSAASHGVWPFPPLENNRGLGDVVSKAVSTLGMLEGLCAAEGWAWIEGMILGGCLAYGLGDLNSSLNWWRRVLRADEGNIEAMANMATTFLTLNHRADAENYWRAVIAKHPGHFESVEHLVGVLCTDHRTKEAVEIIQFVESSIRRPPQTTSDRSTKLPDDESPFTIPPSDHGRLVALIHAKGNMLYTLNDNAGAAAAFEDAVLIATGIREGGINALITRILVVLKAATDGVNVSEISRYPPQSPVLLAPDKAIQTARLVFPPDGKLPGLREVAKGAAEKAAVSTTSNSLLSLAKFFQDGMATGGGKGATVTEILALYYLSLALHESPSTANNVGILLASIQPSTVVTAAIPPSIAASLPGVTGVGVGVALALSYYYHGLKLDENHAHLYTNLGSLLKDINQLPMAIRMYERAVQCDGTFDIALANLANAVKDQGRVFDAIGYYRRAVKANPEFAEAVCGLANALNSVCDWRGRGGAWDGGRRDRWHVDDDGQLVDAKGILSFQGGGGNGWMKRVVEIVEKQLKAGESWGLTVLAPPGILDQFVSDLIIAESGHDGLTTWPESRKMALRASVAAWIGKPYEGAKVVRLIEKAGQRTLWRWYHDRYTRRLNLPESCYRRPTLPAALTTPSAPTVLPFHTFTCPLSATQVRQISERNGLRISVSTLRASWLPTTIYPPPAPPRPCLNVGYVSSDFNNHPLAHLMQSVFGLHNPASVRAFCYATTPSDGSTHRQQIEREAPVFVDAHAWGPERLCKQIVDDGIHILVNLNGFTRGARNEVFAARPAPLQMSFMGFAGTLGAEWCDYLLVDRTAVPERMLRPRIGEEGEVKGVEDAVRRETVTAEMEENQKEPQQEWVYRENVVWARESFFCCDHRQSAPDAVTVDGADAGRRLTWTEEKRRRWDLRKKLFPQIPDDTIILGNFNQLYKIEPTTFRIWLRILSNLPHAILWLLRFPDLGEANLLRTAALWSSPEVASRIIFTDVAPKQLHILRASVCDLFLDTPECNAHTTAVDVLWSGTPLLTLPRWEGKMCSRFAASILRSAVGGEDRWVSDRLVAESEGEYERRAIELGRGLRYRVGEEGEWELGVDGREPELVRMRRALWEGRWTSEVFDTRRWVADLEVAYWEVWRRWERGCGGDVDLESLLGKREQRVTRERGRTGHEEGLPVGLGVIGSLDFGYGNNGYNNGTGVQRDWNFGYGV